MHEHDDDDDDDDEMLGESPIKTVAKLRRTAATATTTTTTMTKSIKSKAGFKPLFASPSGNHIPRDVLGTSIHTNPRTLPSARLDDDAGMMEADVIIDHGDGDDDASAGQPTSSPVGGLFAAQVHQLRRARETSIDAETKKKSKARAAPILPAPSSDDEDGQNDGCQRTPNGIDSSSPVYGRRSRGDASSPHTELTVPSSTGRSTAPPQRKIVPAESSSSTGSPIKKPMLKLDLQQQHRKESGGSLKDAPWQKVQQVELSDDEQVDDGVGSHRSGVIGSDVGPKADGGTRRKTVISITPYQRYGTLRTASFPASGKYDEKAEEEEEEEEGFPHYTIPSSTTANSYSTRSGSGTHNALDNHQRPGQRKRNSNPDSASISDKESADDDDDDIHTSTALAGLKLSPSRHAPSARRDKQQKLRLLNNIFDPSSRNKKSSPSSSSFSPSIPSKPTKIFNPEARFGPLLPDLPSISDPDHDQDYDDEEEDDHYHEGMITGKKKSRAAYSDDDDDDDWQQEVDEDFTFLDSEIELQDVA